MPKSARKKLKPLKGEDRERMARLFEEITGKVQEMSAVMNRIHGTLIPWTKFQISSSDTSGADGPLRWFAMRKPENVDATPGRCGPCPDVDLQ